MQNRIFNSEVGAKDVDGNSMPKSAQSGKAYSASWGQVRKEKGRQIDHKDFSFTGSLIKSIKVEREGDKYRITMSDSVKARNIELQEGKDIFSLSQEEYDLFYEIFTELLIEDIKAIIAKHK